MNVLSYKSKPKSTPVDELAPIRSSEIEVVYNAKGGVECRYDGQDVGREAAHDRMCENELIEAAKIKEEPRRETALRDAPPWHKKNQKPPEWLKHLPEIIKNAEKITDVEVLKNLKQVANELQDKIEKWKLDKWLTEEGQE